MHFPFLLHGGFRKAAVLASALVLSWSLAAQTGPVFAADDVPADGMLDNPAYPALDPSDWALGVTLGLENTGWNDVVNAVADDRMSLDLFCYTGFLNYRMRRDSSGAVTHRGAFSLQMGDHAGLGYRFDIHDDSTYGDQALGFLWRPLDMLSLGAVWNQPGQTGQSLDAGVALRPLAPVPGGAPWLTLTADARVDGAGVAMTTAGGSVALGGAELRGWYDFSAGVPGASLALRTGPGETLLRLDDAAGGRGLAFMTAFRGGVPRTAAPVAVLPSILTINGIGYLPSSRQALPWHAALTGTGAALDLDQVVAACARAAGDPAIAGLVVRGMPALDSDAAGLRLAGAFSLLRKAGKPVLVMLNGADRAQWLAATGASGIHLHPQGNLGVVAPGAAMPFFARLLEEWGIRVVNLGSHDTKSAFNQYSMDSMPKGQRDMLERFYRSGESVMVKAIADGRGAHLKVPAAEVLARGPWLVAKKALEDGLVDALSWGDDFNTAVDRELGRLPGVDISAYAAPARSGHGWGPSAMEKTVVVVYLSGDIGDGPEEPGKGIGSRAQDTLSAIADDSGVAGVILRVNSGGGTILRSASLDHQVRILREKGKKVAVSMADVAASGGYYLASHADRIFAEPATLTGSIGVTGMLLDLSKTMEKFKIRVETVGTADNATFGSYLGLAKGTQATMEEMIQAYYKDFVDVVSHGRNIPADKLEPLCRGQIWTGEEALANGLVDQIGDLGTARAWMAAELDNPWLTWVDVVPGDGGASAPGVPGMVSALGRGADVLAGADRVDAMLESWIKSHASGGTDAGALAARTGELARRMGFLLSVEGTPLYMSPLP